MSISLGTLAILANKAASFQAPSDGVKAILIGNESGLTVTITMESGGVQKTLYPSLLDWFEVRKGFTGNIKITPTVILNNVATFPSSSLVFDAIGINDPEDASMYPISLTRTANIGNTVSTTGGVSSSIQNDNSQVGTQLIEATVAADGGGSAVSVTNDGNMSLGTALHPGSFQCDDHNISTNGAGQLTAVNLVAGSTLTVQSSSSLDNGNISTNGSGTMTVKRIGLTTNGLTAISKFGNYTAGTTGAAFNHNLGTTPDIVICVLQGTAGGAGALHNVKVDSTSYTSTQFTCIADAANISFMGIAIKF